jgi:choline kinase
MRAVILAAGVARRLAPLTDRTQKCLLPVAGVPIFSRMLRALERAGVREVTVVVGHCAAQVREEAARGARALAVRIIDNPEYARGSALSLHAAREELRAGPSLIMDADVVFPALFLSRLLAAPGGSALLSDRGFTDTGEEVKIFERGGRVIALGKKVLPRTWSRVGEGVGFFRCDAGAGADLVWLLERVIAESAGACEYEDALHLLVKRHRVTAVDVTGLPWTEVDFVEDLRRAEERVWPAIARIEGAR